MQYFTEQGSSHLEVVRQIKEKYGDRAKIMTHRNIRLGGFLGLFTREGVEISGYISNEEPLRRKKELMEEKSRIISAATAIQNGGSVPVKTPAEAFGIGAAEPRTPSVSRAGGSSSGELEQVLRELREIKEQVSRQEEDGPNGEHPSLTRIQELLGDNDFSYTFIRDTLTRLKNELSLAELDDFELVQHTVVTWISEKISIYKDLDRPGPRRIILIGPTGVGKTTTIAKLAAMSILGDENAARSVRMITIDNYRIGARGQLETYGDIMNIPVASVETREEMKKKLALFEDVDTVFVDTTGRCPRDFRNIAAMRELLEPCGSRAEYYLAVSATTKASDVKEILREFESFGYIAVVLTKLDETQRVGNIISILAELGKPLAYITFGQGVPADIEKAEPLRLLKNLEGFTINIERLKKEQSLGSGR